MEGSMNNTFDAIILGGGPAGLTAGIYLARAGLKAILLDKQLLGGAPMNTEHIENYPGFPDGISGRELMARMADQARNTGVTINEFSDITGFEPHGNCFITSTEQKSYETSGAIVATGTVPAKLGIAGEDTLIGRGISYCATCDGMFFRGLEVAVIGGGDSALSEALSLANIVSRVYVVHRRQEFRAQKVLQDRVKKNEKIELLLNKVPVRINGDSQVESITLKDIATSQELDLAIAGVFLYVGTRPDTAYLGGLIDRDNVGFIVTDETMATKTPGLFAAGDVRKKDLRQISTAVGDGALAAVSLEKFILHNK
jgi:thioredoxin reductase (NADPH)